MIVRFSDVGEFVQELDRDPNAVARGIVRVTQKFRPVANLGLTALSVVATAKVASAVDEPEAPHDYDVVRFERYVGDLWDMDGHDAEVRGRGDTLITEVSAKLEECGFLVLAGEYMLAETH